MTPDPPQSDSVDEFYVGYEPTMPASIATRTIRVAAAIAVVAVLGAGTLLVAHHRLTPSTFAFGRPDTFEGRLHRLPYPRLEIAGRTRWLAGPGKTGAEAALGQHPDGPVRLRGTLAEHRGRKLIEVVPGSVASVPPTSAPPPPEPPASAGSEVTLVGEIVDSKCFLGVMNPGNGTVHRDCARVCLRGGIPPMLLVRSAAADEALILLVDATGAPIGRAVAALAGMPVTVSGRLVRDGDRLTLFADVTAFVPRP